MEINFTYYKLFIAALGGSKNVKDLRILPEKPEIYVEVEKDELVKIQLIFSLEGSRGIAWTDKTKFYISFKDYIGIAKIYGANWTGCIFPDDNLKEDENK